MSTTLTNGLKLPDKGSVDWYADMQNNYTILDGAVGTIAEHTSQIAGKAPAVHNHTKSDITDLFNSANTWTGDNTFSGSNSFNSGLTINNAALLNAVLQNAVKGDVSTTGDFAIFIKDKVNGNAATSLLAVYRGGQDSGGSYAQINIDTKGNDNNRYNNSILLRINPADNSNDAVLIPQRDKTIDLGTSTNKWKSLNGVNPGALSLPSDIGYDPIDTSNWDLTGNTSNPNFYTPTVDGWLCIIALAGTMTDAWLDIWVNSLWGQSVLQSQSGELFCMIPVRANLTVRIRVKASSIYDARLFVASGNV